MRKLLSVVFDVAPELVEDPDLLERAVLLKGVTRHTSPSDLANLFIPLETDAAVLVRDCDAGDCAGLVVLANPGDCEKAINMQVPRKKKMKMPDGGFDYDPASDVLFYRECLSVSFREGETDNLELEVSCALRFPTDVMPTPAVCYWFHQPINCGTCIAGESISRAACARWCRRRSHQEESDEQRFASSSCSTRLHRGGSFCPPALPLHQSAENLGRCRWVEQIGREAGGQRRSLRHCRLRGEVDRPLCVRRHRHRRSCGQELGLKQSID